MPQLVSNFLGHVHNFWSFSFLINLCSNNYLTSTTPLKVKTLGDSSAVVVTVTVLINAPTDAALKVAFTNPNFPGAIVSVE